MEPKIESITDLNQCIAAEPDSLDIIEVQRMTKLLISVARRQPHVIGILSAAMMEETEPRV